MSQTFDVVIAGGGLAGLTLSLQLHREVPEARVAVVERTRRPLPLACHKVGESLVELSSHYFCDVLGLLDYMWTAQLRKNGLRFLCGDTQGPIARRPEIGPAEVPVLPTFQVDRGRFENDLRAMAEEAGVTLIEGESVSDIELSGAGPQRVHLGEGRVLEGRWVVDATGRRRILQKKLGLRRESPNRASSAWFRVARRIKIGELVPQEETAWHSRDVLGNRWLSTVHLVGKGYWLWLIPLSSEHTSVGIVADAVNHPFATFNKPELAREWMRAHEPLVSSFLEEVPFEDFRVMHDYSYLSAQTLSADRWSCVGEAAIFVDPLYSLGNDFLAMANSYTTRLVRDDLRGALDAQVVEELNAIFGLLAVDASRTLSGNGAIFPQVDVLGAKLWWDFFNYWSFMCAHFFQRVFDLDAAQLARFRQMGQRYFDLNTVAQRVLETWAEMKTGLADKRTQTPLPMFPSVLADQHVALKERLGPEETFAKMERDLVTGYELVAEVVVHALRDLGPAHAEAYGSRIGLSTSGLPLEGRGRVDALPRRERLEAMPRIARDMERALGRVQSPAPLSGLIERALGRAVPELRA